MTARSAPTRSSARAATRRWSASTARDKALAMTTDCTPRYCYADPYEGGKQAVAEAYRNLCAVGATPLAITNCLNFGNPQRPEIMAQIVGCLERHERGLPRARLPDRERQRLPLQREQGDRRRQRDPADPGDRRGRPDGRLGEVGDDRASRPRARRSVLDRPQRQPSSASRCGSSVCHGRRDGPPPPVDLAAERRAGELVRALIADGMVSAVHDCSDGGAAVAIAEMALAGGIGLTLTVVARVRQPRRDPVRRGPGPLRRHHAAIADDRARCVPSRRICSRSRSAAPAATH